jgi:hypothetical protein
MNDEEVLIYGTQSMSDDEKRKKVARRRRTLLPWPLMNLVMESPILMQLYVLLVC